MIAKCVSLQHYEPKDLSWISCYRARALELNSALTFQSRKKFSCENHVPQSQETTVNSLRTFCSISLHQNLSLCILWCLFPKTCGRFFLSQTVMASVAVSMNILGHHNLFCFNRSLKDDDTTSTHPLYLFLLDPCQVKLFLSPWLLISPWQLAKVALSYSLVRVKTSYMSSLRQS